MTTSKQVLGVPTDKFNTTQKSIDTLSATCSTKSLTTDMSEHNKFKSDKCSYTELKDDKLSSSVRDKNIENTFNTSMVSCEEQELRSQDEFPSYALECVQFLDKIPFHDDNIDDNDLKYIDESIVM